MSFTIYSILFETFVKLLVLFLLVGIGVEGIV